MTEQQIVALLAKVEGLKAEYVTAKLAYENYRRRIEIELDELEEEVRILQDG